MKEKKEKEKKIDYKAFGKIRRDDGLVMKFLPSYTFRSYVDTVSSRFKSRTMYSVFRAPEGSEISYMAFRKAVRAASSFFILNGYKKGDKIAIMAESSPSWMIFYCALTYIGLVAVPLLPDFSPLEAEAILKHSEAVAVAVSEKCYQKVYKSLVERKIDLFRLEDLSYLPKELGYPESWNYHLQPGVSLKDFKINDKDLAKIDVEEKDTASIIYTSGTTGSSKAVVLTHLNLLRCADLSTDVYIKVKPGVRVLSILPMSHVYEFTIGQLLTTLQGAHITFLGKAPAVSILLPALSEIRPEVMLSVPLLIEKVYRAAVLPTIRDNKKIAKLIKNPITSAFIYSVIRKKLLSTFGHRLKFFGIGGAPLDPEVEAFLYKAKFPYAIGYGLTETSPLIAGCGPKKSMHKPGFVGKVVEDDEVVLDNKNEEGIGEILVKGVNVMSGYYKRDDLNEEAFTSDGYFRTGDLGYIDRHGFLSIRGRVKTMILGPAGENIYPELIENLINSQEFVEESLVVSENGGLLALIKIDVELMSKKLSISIDEAKSEAQKYVKKLRKTVNEQLNSYSRISEAELQEEPFDRTPTQKIKRFLYPKKKKNSEDKTEKKE